MGALAIAGALVIGVATAVADAGAAPAAGSAAYAPGMSPQGRAAIGQLIEEQRRREEAERARLAGPEARAERLASRSRYRGSSAAEARGLLRLKFGELLDGLLFVPSVLAGQGRIERFVDDYTAQVETPSGLRLLGSLGLPLRTGTGAGAEEAVDLSLVGRDGYFEPRNGLVAARLPSRLEDGVELGWGGVSMQLEGTDGFARGAGVLLNDEQVVYHAVAEDTDFVAAPTALGVEALWQLRSERSPERETLLFTLPAGAELRQGGDGSVEIVRGDETLGRVAAPRAVDAQGREVASSLDVRGHRIDIVTSHRGADVAYPILVDPPVEQDWKFYLRPDAYSYWKWFTSRDGPYHPQAVCNPWVACGTGVGLFIYAESAFYLDGQFGEFVYAPPCASALYSSSCEGSPCLTTPCPQTRSTYVADLAFSNVWHTRQGVAWPSAFTSGAVVGVWSPANFNWSRLAIRTDTFGSGTNTMATAPYSGAPAQNGNTAVFALYQYGNGSRPSWSGFYTAEALLYLDDAEAPTVDVAQTNPPAGWVPGGVFDLEVTGRDGGIGVRELILDAPPTALTSGPGDTRTHPCDGTRELECPRSWTQPFQVDAATLPEGVHTFVPIARDAIGKATRGPGVVYRVDRSPAKITPSGSLFDERGQTLADGVYHLHLDVTDGDAANPRSGVRSVEILVDGERKDYAEQSCTQSCGMSRDFSFNTADYPEGEHAITIVASDQVGNRATDGWRFSTLNGGVGS